MTLITGKKFDPAPLESSIASSALLEDALVFGNGRMFPGVLLFRRETAKSLSNEQLVAELAPEIAKLNEKSQSHARIPRNMLVPIEFGNNRLQKSSKGTILRNKAEATYKGIIDTAYERFEELKLDVTNEEQTMQILQDLIVKIVGSRPEPDTDLFSHGVDSVASIQIREILRKALSKDSKAPPMTIVEDCGTCRALAHYVSKRDSSEDVKDSSKEELASMRDLVEQYSKFGHFSATASADKSAPTTNGESSGEVIVLTGATGALGAYVLDIYRRSEKVSKIYCLVRGTSPRAAEERVHKSLVTRQLPGLEDSNSLNHKIEVKRCKLSEPHLGLSEDDYQLLANTATSIMHLAWSVNFRLRLQSFVKDSIAGLHHLLRLALSTSRAEPPRFVFCSSVASVSSVVTSTSVPEALSNNPEDASPIGYSRSKWVAEQVCLRAATQYSKLQRRLAIVRVGQLSGATDTGVWNMNEAWPMMLASAKLTNVLPDLVEETLHLLPIDIAAQAMVQGCERLGEEDDASNGDAAQVFHLVNQQRGVKWPQMLSMMGHEQEYKVIPANEWIEKLEQMQSTSPDHPCFKLLDHWRSLYGQPSTEKEDPTQADRKTTRNFETAKAEGVMSVLAGLHESGLDKAYFERLWTWIMAQA